MTAPTASTIVSVAGKSKPSKEDHETAARLGLLGLIPGQDLDMIMGQLAELHPPHNTFPAEVLLELAAEAIGESGATSTEPIEYDGIRDRYLPEYELRGKLPQHRSHYALMAAAMISGGVYPDLLDEASGWGLEDMWAYAFYALLIYARAAADRTSREPEEVARSIAATRGIDL
jgi:hypothetical protein